MTVLLDTNILARIADSAHPMHDLAVESTAELVTRGKTLYIAKQCLYEFWVVATRPLTAQPAGMGMLPAEPMAEIEGFERLFSVLAETDEIYHEWKRLVAALDARGKPSHDVRLVAAMNIHSVKEILTFNDKHFRQRFPGITVLSPQTVVERTT